MRRVFSAFEKSSLTTAVAACAMLLAAGHSGLGHGNGAHASDEYYVIESSNPKVQGFDGAAMSFVDYLYELGK